MYFFYRGFYQAITTLDTVYGVKLDSRFTSWLTVLDAFNFNVRKSYTILATPGPFYNVNTSQNERQHAVVDFFYRPSISP